MAGIAFPLFGVQRTFFRHFVSCITPSIETLRHGDDIGVSHSFQRLGREGGPITPRTVQDDVFVPIRLQCLDAQFEKSSRNVCRFPNKPLSVFILLPGIDQDEIFAIVQLFFELSHGHLFNLAPNLGE